MLSVVRNIDDDVDIAKIIHPSKSISLAAAQVPEMPATKCGHHSWDTYEISQEAVILLLEDQKLALQKQCHALESEIDELRSRLQLAAETCAPPPRRASSDIRNAF